MKASEIYNKLQGKVDTLQKEVKNSARDQLMLQCQLENAQARTKKLMQTIIADGDRDLLENELVELGLV